MTRFQGKVALVTGAGSGIGLATANWIADEGGTVVAGILDESQRPAVERFDSVVLDVRSEESWDAALDHLVQAHGGLDVLVNSAGVAEARSIETCDEAFWDKVMNINLKGTFFSIRAAAAALRESRGSIVNVSSTSGLSGDANLSTYCASKGGVVLLTKALSAEFAPEVRVNCVCPGWVDTDMARVYINKSDDPAAARAEIDAESPMGRIARPAEIAASILYLASDAAGIVTGVVLPIDGGSMASG